MSVTLTLRGDGTLEGLDEARAYILESPVRRAQCAALVRECAVPVTPTPATAPARKQRPKSPTSTAALAASI